MHTPLLTTPANTRPIAANLNTRPDVMPTETAPNVVDLATVRRRRAAQPVKRFLTSTNVLMTNGCLA